MSPIWACSPSMINEHLTHAGWTYLRHTVNQVNLVTPSNAFLEGKGRAVVSKLSGDFEDHIRSLKL